ncbi:MAG TPA: GntR family transcriptional regulator [Eubacteriales bacterium]|nr:GntR family transcriptional regulator [Eubacteriales bacterium]
MDYHVTEKNKVSSQKKYIQLYSRITAAISDGIYTAGDKLPTELELADRYGVSRQTVRQALEKLERDGLISKIQGSGSYISSAAEGIKKTMRIAVITTYISTYIFPYILRGIEETSSHHNYSMQLMATNNSIAKERDILQNLSKNTVDGIIVEGTKTALPNPNLSFYRELAGKNIPFVFFNGYYPDLLNEPGYNITYVVTDDYGGAFDATTELIRLGHRSIGGIFKSDDIQGIRRFSGYIDALTGANLRVNDDDILWFSTENKSSIALQLGNSGLLSDCTAIICYNDEIALQLLAYLEKNPGGVTAVRSFDGTFVPRQEGIDFKSFGHPKEKLGRLTAERIIAMIEGEKEESLVMPWGSGEGGEESSES